MNNWIKNTKKDISKHSMAFIFALIMTFIFWLCSTGIKHYETNEIKKSESEIISKIDQFFQGRDTMILLRIPESGRVELTDTIVSDSVRNFKNKIILSESENFSFYYYVYIRQDIDFFKLYHLKPNAYYTTEKISDTSYSDLVNTIRNAIDIKYKRDIEREILIAENYKEIDGKYHFLHGASFRKSVITKNEIVVPNKFSNDIIEYSMNPVAYFTISTKDDKLFKYFGGANAIALVLSALFANLFIYFGFKKKKKKETTNTSIVNNHKSDGELSGE